MCNYALTLCHMIDKMMMSFLKKLEQEFITQGCIRERMHRARTGYRSQQDERLKELEELVPKLQQKVQQAETNAAQWQAAYEYLKQRALKAYYKQQEEIEDLKKQLGK